MEIFLDSAKLEEIKEINSFGILDGVTTNPSLIKKAVDNLKKQGKKVDMNSYIKSILRECNGKPVSLEVLGTDYESMVREGENLFKKFNPVANNVYVKIPINPCLKENCKSSSDGIRAIKKLSSKKIPVNCTLIFTPEQALLASKAGASFVSPFLGRIDDDIKNHKDIKSDKNDYFPKDGLKRGKKILEAHGIVSGIDLTKKIVETFKLEKTNTKVLAASIRNVRQFREATLAGADIATIPYEVILKLLESHKTREGMKNFIKDIVPEYASVVQGNKK